MQSSHSLTSLAREAAIWICVAMLAPPCWADESADLERLAVRYGWTDEGGRVARRSRHLAEFGGIAADLVARVARTRAAVPQHTLGMVCRRYFDWVKDDYSDGHVHADNRERTR